MIKLYNKQQDISHMMKNVYKKNQTAQAISEQILLFFVVIAVITSMSLYVQRSFQAHVRDARHYMYNMINSAPHIGNYYVEYEPYYVKSLSNIKRKAQDSHSEDGQTLTHMIKEETSVLTISEQLPPRNATSGN